MNNVTVIGRLVKDVELRSTQNGHTYCFFTVAVSRRGAKEGQQQADFIPCVAWNKVAELISQHVHKGNLIGLQGALQTSSRDGADGKKIFSMNLLANQIEFLTPKNQSQEAPAPAPQVPPPPTPAPQQVSPQPQAQAPQAQQYAGGFPQGGYGDVIPDDEIPF